MLDPQSQSNLAILSTAILTFSTGFAFGIWTIRGYLFIDPELSNERKRFHNDPLESEESEVDEDDSLLDHAPNWHNRLTADKKQGLQQAAPIQVQMNNSGEECKLVLVVRTDLGMTKGKIAAQCSHATLACYKSLYKHSPGSPERTILSRWERLGQAKIAVQIKSQDEMLALRVKAKTLGLIAEVIQDAGRTQIEAGSMTVLGVGPAPKSLVDQVTGGLKLL